MPTYTINATRDAFERGNAYIQAATPEEALAIFNGPTNSNGELVEWYEFQIDGDMDPADNNDIIEVEPDEEPEEPTGQLYSLGEILDNLDRFKAGEMNRACLEATIDDLRAYIAAL